MRMEASIKGLFVRIDKVCGHMQLVLVLGYFESERKTGKINRGVDGFGKGTRMVGAI